MQVLSAGFLDAARRPGDQHPPQLPARLRRRRPLPPRPRARGQADRRHRPLRHRGARRRPDHRPGRDQGQPPRRGRRPAADRPRHRAPGARPRGQGPRRRPRPARRRPHDRLLRHARPSWLTSQFLLYGPGRWSRQRSPTSRRRSAAPGSPPGSKAPSLLQALRYARDPLGFLVQLQRRYGDIFSLSFPFFGQLVYVADPALVKQLFTGSPEQFHAGEANATVLEPALGPNSVLTLDDAPHMQQRKLLLPPFHGERVRGYGELIRETTAEADGDLAGRRALRPAPPHPADHPGGDHARRLRRPRRAAPGPLRAADRGLQQAGRR